MAKKQIEFDRQILIQKRFTLDNMIQAKLNQLSDKMHKLKHSDLIWLSRVEDFYHQNEYLTEKQINVLDSIVNRTNQASWSGKF